MKSAEKEAEMLEKEAIIDEINEQEENLESNCSEVCENEESTKADNLAEEAAQWHDKYLRMAAEFDNFRKRTLKEKMDLIEYSGKDVIKPFLSVIDDMERAVQANEKSDSIDSVKEGVILIYNKMLNVLKQSGVSEINALGEKLDTDLHDAIAKFPADHESKKGYIMDVLEKGYKLKDKVIRFAKVVVGE